MRSSVRNTSCVCVRGTGTHHSGVCSPSEIVLTAACVLQTHTFTFMHLADAFIQSDLHCIQVTVFTFYQLLLSKGIEPMILALLAPCSTIWATGKCIITVSVTRLCSPFGLKLIKLTWKLKLAIMVRGRYISDACLRCSANHNALGQLANQSRLHLLEGGAL